MSATLKTGKSCCFQDNRMKSVTSPKRTRSIRLPTAPPRINASDHSRARPRFGVRAHNQNTASEATTENT